MSKSSKEEVPLTKDGHPDRRTVAGREAAAAEGEASPRKGKDGVPLNKDGTPDRRTVEGREVSEGSNSSSSSSADSDRRSSKSSSGDVPLNKDGTPDRRTVEGREAAEGGDSSRSRENEAKTRLDGEVDKRTVEGRQQVHEQKDGDSGRSSSSSDRDRSSSDRSSSSSSSNKSSGEHQFEEGDAVVFNIGSNNLHGTISRVLTKEGEVDGRIAHGSKDEPRYAVKYEGTGVEQIRTEGALRKDESQSSNDSGKQSDKSSGSSQSPRSTRSSDSRSSESDRRDDRYRKGHKFEEGETVVFHIGKQTLHGKIAKVSERSGDYKVAVGSDTITASEKDLEKDDKSKSSSGSSSSKGGDNKFNEGDSVTFNIGLNNLHGTITRVITDEDEVDGRIAHGSKDEPRYAVQYEGTGVEQIRTEGALKKDDEGKMDEDNSNKRKREDENKDNRESRSSPSAKKTKSSK